MDGGGNLTGSCAVHKKGLSWRWCWLLWYVVGVFFMWSSHLWGSLGWSLGGKAFFWVPKKYFFRFDSLRRSCTYVIYHIFHTNRNRSCTYIHACGTTEGQPNAIRGEGGAPRQGLRPRPTKWFGVSFRVVLVVCFFSKGSSGGGFYKQAEGWRSTACHSSMCPKSAHSTNLRTVIRWRCIAKGESLKFSPSPTQIWIWVTLFDFPAQILVNFFCTFFCTM